MFLESLVSLCFNMPQCAGRMRLLGEARQDGDQMPSDTTVAEFMMMLGATAVTSPMIYEAHGPCNIRLGSSRVTYSLSKLNSMVSTEMVPRFESIIYATTT